MKVRFCVDTNDYVFLSSFCLFKEKLGPQNLYNVTCDADFMLHFFIYGQEIALSWHLMK